MVFTKKIKKNIDKRKKMIYNTNVNGVMAQLVERLVRNEEASGSNPLSSTTAKGTAKAVPFAVVGYSQEVLNSQRFARATSATKG